jgi:hypothetical protein
MKRLFASVVGIVVALCIATSALHAAAPIKVDCGNGGSISATLADLTRSGNTRGVTILVAGTCRENIAINAFDHLALQGASSAGSPNATLQDVSNGNQAVVLIYNSHDVGLSNFTINGGLQGVDCETGSYCSLFFDRIQNSDIGVRFAASHGVIEISNISNNASQGLRVVDGASVITGSNVIRSNRAAGILCSRVAI